MSITKLSAFELGGRLSETEKDRVENALDRIERLCRALFPVRIDLSDCAALREALEAYESGNAPWMEAQRKLSENPQIITF